MRLSSKFGLLWETSKFGVFQKFWSAKKGVYNASQQAIMTDSMMVGVRQMSQIFGQPKPDVIWIFFFNWSWEEMFGWCQCIKFVCNNFKKNGSKDAISDQIVFTSIFAGRYLGLTDC